jgi:pimeloyl-ACP methyl ester carboxylesterase
MIFRYSIAIVIAPDMRGLGISEKPLTGYDKKTIAEDIFQLVKKLLIREDQ